MGSVCGEVLERAHQNQRVHCDVSPANILVCKDNAIVLNDWGSARPLGSVVAELDDMRGDFVSPRVSKATSSGQEALYGAMDDLWALFLVLCHFAMTDSKPRPKGVGSEARAAFLSTRRSDFGTDAWRLLKSCLDSIDLRTQQRLTLWCDPIQPSLQSQQLHISSERFGWSAERHRQAPLPGVTKALPPILRLRGGHIKPPYWFQLLTTWSRHGAIKPPCWFHLLTAPWCHE